MGRPMMGARMRKLTPQQEDATRALYGNGVPARVLAGMYGVSSRTILRTIDRTPLAVEVVVLGGYYAQFELRADGPFQRTEWRAVA